MSAGTEPIIKKVIETIGSVECALLKKESCNFFTKRFILPISLTWFGADRYFRSHFVGTGVAFISALALFIISSELSIPAAASATSETNILEAAFKVFVLCTLALLCICLLAKFTFELPNVYVLDYIETESETI
ncbi:MAG: hypothetical protein LBC09_06970, partial [Helicobacteraceae bacterium]|nr:hypothetical protein [Helicobacteraceae bacterium]